MSQRRSARHHAGRHRDAALGTRPPLGAGEARSTAAQAIPTASLTSGAAGVYAGVAPWYGPAIALSSSLALDSHLGYYDITRPPSSLVHR